jgi:hypothetical protein
MCVYRGSFYCSLRIKSELEAVSEDGQRLIQRYGNLSDFLSQDDDLAIIDDFMCMKADTETARHLALKLVLEKVSEITVVCRNESPPNIWNTKSHPPVSSSAMDSILQLPKVDSLFDYASKVSASKLPIGPPPLPASSSSAAPPFSHTTSIYTVPSIVPKSFPMPPPPIQPDLSSPPPPSLIKANGGGGYITTSASSLVAPYHQPVSTTMASILSSGMGGLNFNGTSADTMSKSTVESLNKRLHGLSICNADLMKQISEKDKQIKSLTKLVDPQCDLINKTLRLEKELLEAKAELVLLKTDVRNNSNSTSSNFPCNNEATQLVIALQKQLESEKLNSRNLKHQVEIERIYSAKINDKHNNLMKQLHAGFPAFSPTPATLNTAVPSSRIGLDSFGLRNLLANTGSGGAATPSSAATTAAAVSLVSKDLKADDKRNVFSSSAGSSLLKKPAPAMMTNIATSTPFSYASYQSTENVISTTTISDFSGTGRSTGTSSTDSSIYSTINSLETAIARSKERAGSLATIGSEVGNSFDLQQLQQARQLNAALRGVPYLNLATSYKSFSEGGL